jgi:Flp pilus assembly protein TadD
MPAFRNVNRWRLLRLLFSISLLAAVGVIAWVPLCLQRATRALALQDLGGAEAWLDRADIVPWSAGERAFLRARWCRQLGRTAEFAKSLRKARLAGYAQEPLQREILLSRAQAGELGPLEEQLSDLLIAGNDLSAICEAYVAGCMLQYRMDEALRILKLWQEDFPNDPRPHFLRGRLYEHQAALGEAENEFRTALKLAPRHAPSAFNLGRILLQKQVPAEALLAYQTAADSLFESQPGLLGVAKCQRELGKLDAARRTLQRALQRPKDRLIEAYRILGEPAETALSQAPAEMAQLEIAAGNDAEAARWMETALTAYPQDWKLRYIYATTLERLGRTEEAQSQAERSQKSREAFESCDHLLDRLSRNPADVEARYRVGCVLLEHFSANQGLVWLNSVFTYDPQHRGAHQRLAEYFAAHLQENPEYSALAELHARAVQAAGSEEQHAKDLPP